MTASDQALVFEIQRFSTEDGPGIRTTVFLKGCPLHCTWCHNPESIAPHPEIHWLAARCIGCQGCVAICPEGALAFSEQGLQIDRGRCTRCGICVEECPGTALEQIGRYWQLDDLVAEVGKDTAYYETSGGGVTLSGGEPTRQPEFAAAFFQQLRARSIHTALDTCGLCRPETLDQLLPHADLVLFDLKLADPGLHQQYTGSGNRRILDNFQKAAAFAAAPENALTLWVRTPVIPGATAAPENIAALGGLITDRGGPAVRRWELCAFNNLCRDKYDRLDQSWDFVAAGCLTAETMEALAQTARDSGVNPDIVHWTGSTAVPREAAPDSPALRVINGEKEKE